MVAKFKVVPSPRAKKAVEKLYMYSGTAIKAANLSEKAQQLIEVIKHRLLYEVCQYEQMVKILSACADCKF